MRPIPEIVPSLFLLRLLLLLLLLWVPEIRSQVPGEVYTETGYDNVNGTDPICWSAPLFQNRTNNTVDDDDHVRDFDGVNWHSDLEPNFVAGPTSLQSSCWDGTAVFLDILPEQFRGSYRLRTGRYYTYHVVARVNLEVLRQVYGLPEDSFFYSSDGLHDVGFRIEFCPVNGNLCSPFILGRHDELESHIHVDGDDHDGGHERRMKEHSAHPDRHDGRKRRKLYLRTIVNHGEEYNQEHGLSQYHDGLHYHEERQQLYHLASEFFLIPVNITNETEFEFHLDVDVQVSVPGNYLPLAAFEFFLSNTTSNEQAAYKFDVANLLSQRSVTYYEKPTIQSVSLAMEVVSYVIIAVAGLALVFFMSSTWRHRKHSVMKLAQCEFLLLLQFAGFFATLCSVLYNPKSNAHCYLQNPMTTIPIQLMLAIVLGRLRRILAIMAPLMNWNSGKTNSRERKQNFKNWKRALMNRNTSVAGESGVSSSMGGINSELSTEAEPQEVPASAADPPRFVRALQRWKEKHSLNRQKSIRLQFTTCRLWLIIILVTLPMVVLEIVGLAVFSPQLQVDMNAQESDGRYECGTDREQIYFLATTCVPLITLFAALIEAQKSRNLPGMFNEAASVSFALISSLFVAGLGSAVVVISKDPSASPDIPYISKVVIVTFISTSISTRLTYPKLKLIWNGEQVVVSKMIRDHRESARSKDQRGPGTTSVLVSGISDSVARASDASTHFQHHYEKANEGKETKVDVAAHDALSVGEEDDDPPSGTPERRPSVTFEESTMEEKPPPKERLYHSRSVLFIRENQAPPDRLAMRVMSHTQEMSHLNERILSGLCIEQAGWERVHQSLKKLDEVLDHAEYC